MLTMNDDKIKLVQKETDETKELMKENIKKVIKNSEALEILDEETKVLEQSGAMFRNNAGRVKKNFFMRNIKLIATISIVFFIFILIVIFALVPWHK